MARYEIIDEPRSKPWGENIIVDPVVILFAAIIVPLFWQPPMFGRFWMPMLWLAINGYALGSHTLGKEVATLIVGALVWWGLLTGVTLLLNNGTMAFAKEDVYPYITIFTFGIFFLTLYLVVFQQSRSYQLFKYVRDAGQ